MSSFQEIVKAYDGYDLDGKGNKEIESLKFLWLRNHQFDDPTEAVDPDRKLVIVVTEV